MHPLVNLVSLVVFSLGLALGQLKDLWLAFLLLPIYWVLCGQLPGNAAWQMLRRLRWFFLSILVIYLWFTPGEWIWPSLRQWSPTYSGLSLALHRLAVLLCIVLAVATLLRALSMAQLMAALRQLFHPLRMIGFPVDRFALRLTLTVDAAQRLLLDKSTDKFGLNDERGLKGRLSALAQILYQRFKLALQVPEYKVEIEILTLPAPALWQWAWPGFMMLAFIVLN